MVSKHKAVYFGQSGWYITRMVLALLDATVQAVLVEWLLLEF